jgi:hypothetical protein
MNELSVRVSGTNVMVVHCSRAFFSHHLEKSARFPLRLVVLGISVLDRDPGINLSTISHLNKLLRFWRRLASRLQ